MVACFPGPLSGLDPATPLEHYTLDLWNWRQGLPEETSTAIRQTPDGYLWIATANGLYRFNGSRAVEVSLPQSRFSDRRLRTVEVDRKGLLWVMATSGAIWRDAGTQGSNSSGVASSSWLNLVLPKVGINYSRAGIRSLADRVRVLNDSKVIDFPADAGQNAALGEMDLPADSIASTIAPNGLVFAAREKGQVVRHLPSGGWQELFSLNGERIHTVQAGQRDVLWLRTASAVLRWQGGKLERWPLPKDFVGSTTYYPFIEDHQGTIWLGGRGGLARLQGGKLKVLALGNELSETPVSSLFEDREGALWIGTLTGTLIRLRDCGAYAIGRAEGLAGDVINSILVDPTDEQSALQSYAVHSMNQGITMLGGQAPQVHEAHAGNLWFMARDPVGGRIVVGNGERQFQLVNGQYVELSDPYRRQLGEIKAWLRDLVQGGYVVARADAVYRQDSLIVPGSQAQAVKLADFAGAKLMSLGQSGMLWASDGKRVVMIAGGGVETLSPHGQQPDDAVYCLRWDAASERLWIGTNRGFVVWDPKKRQWSRRGLESDQVFLLERDTLGSIWAGTRNGLVRVAAQSWLDGNPQPALRLLHSDGLKNVNFGMTRGQGSALLSDGSLLFGSMGGLVVLDPANLRPPRFAPTPVFEQILAGESGKPARLDGMLPAGTRRVEIRFDAFAVSTSSPVQVDYRLKGVDESWQHAGNGRSVQYTNLRPGTYAFVLRASWPDGSGAREAVASWTIPPQWYEHPMVVLSVTGLIMAGLIWWVRQREHIRLLREQELQSRVEDRTRELSEAKQMAESAARVKSDFLATMSHELRTPMNGVLGLAEILQATELNSEQQALVKTLRGSGESLLALVNDILDLSKIESGRFELERIPVSIPNLLLETTTLIRPMAEKKGLHLRLSCEGDALEWIEADPGRIRQILLNLIGNAIKFTPAGEVHVHASWGPGIVRIEVRDQGIGIPKEKLSELFQNFVQVDSSNTRLYGGTGLGLAISKRLVEAMKGAIHCTSEPGAGSCFSFWIPAVACAAPQIASAPRVDRSLDGFTVLVAEDNRTNQWVIRGLLEMLGMAPVIVSNGAEALETVASQSFDFILMDCQMPVMDGYEAAGQILAKLGSATPPIIALTANALESDKQRCLDAGMTGYLTKPLSLDRLREALQESLAQLKA